MSFRELRNFTEMMRALGYPRLISLDNFRTPNFELVADILYWLVKRYDPDIAVSDNIESEDDRVEFLVGVAHAMINKAHIKLNARRLYAADGNAVRELLKLSSVLYDATRAAASGESSGGNPGNFPDRSGKANNADADADEPLALLGQLGNVKAARQLATEITERGAKLHDLLGREKDFRRARFRALAFLDAVAGGAGGGAENRHLEGSVRELVATARDNAAALARQCEDLAADERALGGKIQKATTDLDRTQKRYRSLQAHRPAFANELEKLEGELQRYYEVYLERFRNLDYLEGELERHHKSETEELMKYERWRDRTAEENRNNMMKQFLGRMPDGTDAEGATAGGGGSGRATASSRGGGSSRGSGDVTTAGSDAAAAGRRGRGRDARGGGGGGGSGGRAAGGGGGSSRGARAENSRGAGRPEAAGAAPRSRGGEGGGGGGGGAALEDSGSDLDGAGSEGGSSSEEEVSLNNSEETGSLVDDDDESSRGAQSRSYSASDAEAF